jgi:hypothetical protein
MLLCLFVLAGITADTTGMRMFIAVYTLAFLTLAFGAAITIWAREDAATLQATCPAYARATPGAHPTRRHNRTRTGC